MLPMQTNRICVVFIKKTLITQTKTLTGETSAHGAQPALLMITTFFVFRHDLAQLLCGLVLHFVERLHQPASNI